MNFLITGAQMDNKGAQSMLFVTVDELTRRYPGSRCYFLTEYDYDDAPYTFQKLLCGYETKRIALAPPGKRAALLGYAFLKDCAKTVLRKKGARFHYLELYRLRDTIDAILDISGFAVGDKWSVGSHEFFLDTVRFAKRYDIPLYLMPQSFGPFAYPPDRAFLRAELQEWLQVPRLIFARERQGLESLREIGVQNALLSSDLVLQNKGVNRENIYKNVKRSAVETIDGAVAVCLVPNTQCLRHGDAEGVEKLYAAVIEKLLALGNTVCLTAHSKDDTALCRRLKARFREEARVLLRDGELDCFGYDEFVRQFKYIVCSRYHGIVHAYRNAVPAILLGWADKYKELAESVGQSGYYFDITDPASCAGLPRALEAMEQNHAGERAVIEAALRGIRENNCFDLVCLDISRRSPQRAEGTHEQRKRTG